MLILQRITSEYIATEDRFRLSGITEQGGEVRYWITQRLLLRLLGFLLDWLAKHREELEKQAATAMLGPMVTKLSKHRGRGDTQTTGGAIAEQGAESAENAPADDESPAEDQAAEAELLFEADIRIASNRITLVFKPRHSEHSQLSLQLDEAWQWIAILHTLWQRAEWNLAVWPDWIDQVKAPHPSKSWGSLH